MKKPLVLIFFLCHDSMNSWRDSPVPNTDRAFPDAKSSRKKPGALGISRRLPRRSKFTPHYYLDSRPVQEPGWFSANPQLTCKPFSAGVVQTLQFLNNSGFPLSALASPLMPSADLRFEGTPAPFPLTVFCGGLEK
jgi:hypothetical protein